MLVVFGVLVKTLCPTSTEDGERASVQPVSYSDASATRNKLVGEAIQSLFLENAIKILANKCAICICKFYLRAMASNDFSYSKSVIRITQ